MSEANDPAPRSLRADARRNRDRLVEVARTALLADGADASLGRIARDAGVGIGTLYRHFPTREALVEAVYAAELDRLTDAAPALLAELAPEVALREWAARYAEFAATKRGMLGAMSAGRGERPFPGSATRERVVAAVAPLLAAGAARGTLRADVDPDDVVSLLLGVFLATASSPSDDATGRLLDLVLDALRPRADTCR